jgi:hypothetical protein
LRVNSPEAIQKQELENITADKVAKRSRRMAKVTIPFPIIKLISN